MYKKLVLFSLISVFSFDAYSASLRTGKDVFAEPAKGGLAQVLLGLSELGAAKAVWPGMEREEQALAQAEKELALVRRTPTTEIEKIARIEAAGQSIAANNMGSVKVQVIPRAANQPTLAEELAFVSSSDVVSVEEKGRRIAAAEEAVAVRRQVALQAMQDMGFLDKTIRILRKGATVVLAGDILGRVYVWGVLGADPGLTPVVGYTAEQIRALLE